MKQSNKSRKGEAYDTGIYYPGHCNASFLLIAKTPARKWNGEYAMGYLLNHPHYLSYSHVWLKKKL